MNTPRDSLILSTFVKNHVSAYFSQHDWIRDILRGADPPQPCTPEIEQLTPRLHKAISAHRRGIPAEDADWGWKSPNSFYLLPFFHGHFPDLRVIHIIRDGLDVAYQRNRREFTLYRQLFLDAEELDAPEPVQLMAIWSRTNLAAARYASRHLGERYLRVRLEDLSAEPRRVVAQIFDFLGPPSGDGFEAAVAEVIRPASIGRWMRSFGPEIGAVRAVGEEALREFGYSTDRHEQIQLLLSQLEEKDRELEDLRTPIGSIRAVATALRASSAARAAAAYRRVRRRVKAAIQPFLR